jgi:quercetin dioxygenase-like cupin family protein
MTRFEKGKALNPNEAIAYQEGGIVSMELLHNDCGSITLFSFGKGQQLSPHSAPLDALLQVTDGEMVLTLDDEPHRVKAGEIFMIPAGHVHSVKAESNFKMIITMVAAERKVTFEHQHNK